MVTKNDMDNITEVVGKRFNDLPADMKVSPVAMLEWTLTNTFQLISAIQEKAILERVGDTDLILEIAEQNPHVTGHQIVASAPRC